MRVRHSRPFGHGGETQRLCKPGQGRAQFAFPKQAVRKAELGHALKAGHLAGPMRIHPDTGLTVQVRPQERQKAFKRRLVGAQIISGIVRIIRQIDSMRPHKLLPDFCETSRSGVQDLGMRWPRPIDLTCSRWF